MNATKDGSTRRGLRAWWADPPRSGMRRLIAPWEYRHARVFGVARIAGAGVAAAPGVICLAYSAYAWAAFFLAIAALNLAGGYWLITIARSQARDNRGRESLA
ncbi:MAG TPA: hypothetical protein VHX66_10195 [Solirubrobacteraceae bacterium]|jgi:hypothetical protein|nr:hypothetical protein [Solirubrobacteraceae bacterium]